MMLYQKEKELLRVSRLAQFGQLSCEFGLGCAHGWGCTLLCHWSLPACLQPTDRLHAVGLAAVLFVCLCWPSRRGSRAWLVERGLQPAQETR
jgi:hypothetical protein